MMMLDYVNLLVEYIILSHKDNYYILISRIATLCVVVMVVLVVIVIYIYIYIYGYNLFVILYDDGVVLVWIIEYQHLCPRSRFQYCMSDVILSSKDNDYKIIHNNSSFVSSGID